MFSYPLTALGTSRRAVATGGTTAHIQWHGNHNLSPGVATPPRPHHNPRIPNGPISRSMSGRRRRRQRSSTRPMHGTPGRRRTSRNRPSTTRMGDIGRPRRLLPAMACTTRSNPMQHSPPRAAGRRWSNTTTCPTRMVNPLFVRCRRRRLTTSIRKAQFDEPL